MSIIPLPRQMTSIISPFLCYICTALLSPLFCCHPLSVCLSLTIFPPSVYLSIIFFSILLSFFYPPLSFILLFQLTFLFCISLTNPDLSFPPVLLIQSKPSSHLLLPFGFSVPFYRHYLRHHSHSAVSASLSSITCHCISSRFRGSQAGSSPLKAIC